MEAVKDKYEEELYQAIKEAFSFPDDEIIPGSRFLGAQKVRIGTDREDTVFYYIHEGKYYYTSESQQKFGREMKRAARKRERRKVQISVSDLRER